MQKVGLILLALALVASVACSIALQGGNGLDVAGNSTDNSVTLSLDGSVVRGVHADTGNATGADNWLSIVGSGNVTTSASGSTITINCDSGEGGAGNSTYALDSDKLDGLHGSSYLLGNATAVDSTLFAGLSAAQWATLIDIYALADIDTMKFTTDSGNATPSSQVVHVVGSGSVSTAASGHTITITGTDNDTAMGSKVKSYTRASNAASGDVAYTGVGFTPTSLQICTGSPSGYSGLSVGYSDSACAEYGQYYYGAGTPTVSGSFIVRCGIPGSYMQQAVVKSYDADGFTLTWTRDGSGSSTTSVLQVICYK